MASQELKDIIADIGAYFGIRSADSYLASLVEGDDAAPAWPIDSTKEEDFARGTLLNAICARGDTSMPTLKAIIEYIDETGEEFFEDICITPNDESVGSSDTFNALDCGGFTDQGFLAPAGDFYTVDDIRGEDKDGGDGTTPIHVIQVFPAVSSVSTADTDVTALLMNSIPTLEMSRAVPYLDVLAIRPIADDPQKTRTMSLGRWLVGEHNTDAEIGDALYNSEDLVMDPPDEWQKGGSEKTNYRTLGGMELFTSPVTLTNADRLFNGQWAAGKGEWQDAPPDPFKPFMTMEKFKVDIINSGFSVIAFKMADLTLVLHDRARLKEIGPLISPKQWGTTRFIVTYGWAHPDGNGLRGNLVPGRAADANSNRFGQLIDAMRVTETYSCVTSNFAFNQDGSVGIDLRLAMVGASGVEKIDITLAKVANFAKEVQKKFDEVKDHVQSYRKTAGQLGDVEMPQNIGSMMNVNSAMRMEQKELKELMKELRARRKDSDMSKVESITTYLMGKDGNGGALKKLKNMKTAALKRMIRELRATPDPWLSDHAQLFGKKVADGRKENLLKYDDGREEKSQEGKIAVEDIKEDVPWMGIVSLGKVITKFFGDALAKDGSYEEVQLLFHPLNESAGYMHGQNMARFPIAIDDLYKVMVKQFDHVGQMSLQRFLGFINSYFLRDFGAIGYGFAEYYGERDPDQMSKRGKLRAKVAKKGKKGDKKSMPLINDARQFILRNAYLGADAYAKDKSSEGNVTFKLPAMQVKMETAPMRKAVKETAENGPIPAKTILKIHIFDAAINPHKTLQDTFVAFAQSGVVSKMIRKPWPQSECRWARTEELIANQFKMLQKRGVIDALEVDGSKVSSDGHPKADLDEMAFEKYVIAPSALANMKGAIYKMTPSLVWGGLSAGIIEGKWQSYESGPLNTVMLLRQPDKEDMSDGSDGFPMEISPTKASLETVGCPFFNFAQQYFIDFGTNTTADNFYGVFGVTHTLTPGEFTTSVELGNLAGYGRLRSAGSAIAETVLSAHISKNKEGDE